jgi:hypothetical protein
VDNRASYLDFIGDLSKPDRRSSRWSDRQERKARADADGFHHITGMRSTGAGRRRPTAAKLAGAVADPLHAEEGVSRLAVVLLASFAVAPTARLSAGEACAGQPQSSQFDFWVGAWDVTPTEGQPDAGKVIATSREEKFAGGCALMNTGWGTRARASTSSTPS